MEIICIVKVARNIKCIFMNKYESLERVHLHFSLYLVYIYEAMRKSRHNLNGIHGIIMCDLQY